MLQPVDARRIGLKFENHRGSIRAAHKPLAAKMPNEDAIEIYQDFLNDFNKLAEPGAQKRLIYSGGEYFVQSGTHIQLLERDPLYLAIIANLLCRQREREQLDMLQDILEKLVAVVERLSAAKKKSVRFS